MEKPKITFFHDNFISENKFYYYSNGSLTKNVIKRYLKLCSNFTLVARFDNKRDINKLSKIGGKNEINFISIPNFMSLNFFKFISAVKKIKKIDSESGFLIVRLPSFIGFLTLFLKGKNNDNIIIEQVGCPLQTFKHHSILGYLLSSFLYMLNIYYVRNAQNIIYVTKYFLQNKYYSKASNQLSCSDVDIEIDKSVLENKIKSIDLSNKKIYRIGMIGSLQSQYKGFETAFKSLQVLNNSKHSFNLELVGGGNLNYVNKLVQKFNISKNVIIRGSMSHPNEIFNWLDNIDFYIHPSKSEGLPRSLIEAMSRCCCCFASNVGGIPELLDSKFLHKKNDFLSLSSLIINHLDKNKMKENIEFCFEKAKKYESNILNNKRDEFFNNVLKPNS